MKVEASIDAAVRALLLLGGTGSDLAERPPLELVFVFFGEFRRPGVVGGLADDFIRIANLRAKGIGEALLDESDGKVGNVDADPAPIEALRDLNGGSATAEGIEDEVAFVYKIYYKLSTRARSFFPDVFVPDLRVGVDVSVEHVDAFL